MRSRSGLVLAAVAPLALAACTGGGDDPELTPQDRLAEAKAALDDTSGVHLTLEADELPPSVDGLLSADGVGTHAPAFEGEIRVATGGLTAKVDVIAVDGAVHAVLPFTTGYSEIDPADYGAPDPARLMSTEGGLSSLLTSVEEVEAGEDVRDGERVLSTFRGTLPGEVVAGVIPSARTDADFDTVLTVDDGNRLTSVEMTGPFYPEADAVTYTVGFDEYGTDRDIQAP